MANVLYISYTGLLDPLGQSQVLQYVLGLARDHRITLLSFEKPHLVANKPELNALTERCRSVGVDWHRLTYHNRPGIPATIYDIVVGMRKATALARAHRIQTVHCRSYIAGIIGLTVKRNTGACFIFDMRGFWPDERVDGGVWKREWMRYRAFKWIERRLFLGADHVVSLTQAGKREIEAFDYLKEHLPPISVIPTCTNIQLFRPVTPDPQPTGAFTLGYLGSAGSWYMFEEIAKTVSLLFRLRPSSRFLVINKDEHVAIRKKLVDAGVDLNRVEIISAPFVEVSKHIARMNAGIFFYRPTWSKTATSPTRLGEFLACGKPVLANTGVGDVERTLRETSTGIGIDDFEKDTLLSGLKSLIEISEEPDIVDRCVSAAERRFSLDHGVAEYSRIYRRLSGSDSESAKGIPA
ncbi:glycosyltransferase [Marimonas sp. MJW-29]|uniref:Glycosyltransferase n=1 Tax=Sulfitobacter sediminis TaxID=3234186 RepID=A0ABV3RMY5_9RHOB